MLHYILQTLAFQVFFLLVYDLFLKNETFFNWNRVYLIGTAFLSFTLPFLKFESIKAIVPEPMIIRLPEVIIGEISPAIKEDIMMVQPVQISEQALSFSWTYVWIIGMILTALILAYKIIKIWRILYKNPQRWQGDALIVFLLNSNAAYSFFHYIFLGTDIQAEKKEHIIHHEMVHVKEKHSLDLLIFEVLKILFWFNPLVYMYQNRLATLHEFIADAKAVKHNGKSDYYQNLLSQVFETENVSFVNYFFHQSLIKKRIIMLNKSKSKQIHLVKYALLVPMVSLMLMYTSSYASVIKDPFPFMQKEVLNQELTFQELVDKYYNEILERKGSKSFFIENYKDYLNVGDKQYIQSKQDLAKSQAFMKHILAEMRLEKKNEDLFAEADKEGSGKGLKKYETYEDYLEFKKTEKAKLAWENMARGGELRLVVDDMKNLTDAEEKRRAEKMAMIKNDEFFYALFTTDGKMSTTIDFGKKVDENKKETFESMDIEVPFAVIEKVPLFEGCESSGSQKDDKMCTSDHVAQFVNRNFNVDIATEKGLKGRQRINVIFKIGKDGKIRDVMARAPHPALEAEAIRVIQSMPDFTPGEQKGEAVTVPYSLPILFQVQDDTPETPEKNADSSEQEDLETLKASEEQKILGAIEIPYAVVDEVPVFPSCETMESNEDRKQCTTEKIADFVNKNFNTSLAKELGLTGRQRLAIIFKIGIDGSVSNIHARAKHPELEKEAVRVIEALPKMIPGKQKGKVVVVPYSLPIIF